jgi:hypothetical protein
MTQEIEASVTLIGMPETGKTTYVAALYHQLHDPPAGGTAKLRSQPVTRAYLEGIRGSWLSGKPVGRTPVEGGEDIRLHIENDGVAVTLQVPDVSGETFASAFATRQIDRRIATSVEAADGLLVFTTPDRLSSRILLTDGVARRANSGERTDGHEGRSAVNTEQQSAAFDHSSVPGETQLIDLLQWVLDRQADAGRLLLRCCLLISAWDTMPAPIDPGHWVASQARMLNDFLSAHKSSLDARIYGLSAQGGDYANEDLSEHSPHDRPYLIDLDGQRSTDLWAPVHWVVSR